MSKKGLYSPVIRRLFTALLLIGVTGSFLAIYYFAYLPQTRMRYNAQNFRILHEMSSNFKQRIENYGLLYTSIQASKERKDSPLNTNLLRLPKDDFNKVFWSSFRGNPENNIQFRSVPNIVQDSIRFRFYQITDSSAKGKKTKSDSTTLSLKSLLEPIIQVHASTFESLLLIKQPDDSVKMNHATGVCYDSILYKSENTDITNIATDSLFHNQNIQTPVISDLDIEGSGYKLFLLPFKINSEMPETYVLAGLVSVKTYRQESQDIPVALLVTLCFILIVLLLVLPFLKVFFLSSEESITIRDVRAIILVIYIIPVFATLVCAGVWLSQYRKEETIQDLQKIQHSIEQDLYGEIRENFIQIKQYDSFMANPYGAIDDKVRTLLLSLPSQQQKAMDVKDVIFFPRTYKNFTGLHWLNANGNEIAVWTLTGPPPSYIKLGDRQYFNDIKNDRGFLLPQVFVKPEKVSIQPVLSRLTGDYTINLVTKSDTVINTNMKAVLVGTSSKMYSVWNTVLPKGFSFCLVDESGSIVCHSDTARSLQENIFQECSDSLLLHNIMNRKDSAVLPDVDLYDNSVRMILKPLPNLPYYLITYYNKRSEYLFLFHILAFVFVCESVVLMLMSLLSYLVMMNYKKISKLLFSTADHDWLIPSADKKYYYLKILLQTAASALLVGIFSLFFRGDDYYLYTLNTSVLLPLFTVIGYYVVRESKKFIQREKEPHLLFDKNRYGRFLIFISKIVILYALSLCLFFIFQNALFFNVACENAGAVKAVIIILIILEFVSMIFIGGLNLDALKNKTETSSNNSYLTYFILSLFLSIFFIGVAPSLTFTSYAFREEKMLQMQSSQIDLAKKIQQRRDAINADGQHTKLNIYPFAGLAKTYLSGAKFDTGKGIYLDDKNKLVAVKNFKSTSRQAISCSQFYKLVTHFLFLPPDHDEFYDEPSHSVYYYWTSSFTSKDDNLALYYRNSTDNTDASSFTLSALMPHTGLFGGFFDSYPGVLLLFILSILIFLFYKLISSASKRIFLIGFFKDNNKAESQWLKECYQTINLKRQCESLFKNDKDVNFTTVKTKERQYVTGEDNDEKIIRLHLCLQPVYENIWKRLSDVEKYTLYDFATDGFTNYKQSLVLYNLHQKGLVIREDDGNITVLTKSFRNFLLTKASTEEVKRMNDESKKGSWGMLRTVFYIVLIAVAVFIFISQEEASKRLITIVTSLGALLPVILKLFDKSTFRQPDSKASEK